MPSEPDLEALYPSLGLPWEPVHPHTHTRITEKVHKKVKANKKKAWQNERQSPQTSLREEEGGSKIDLPTR